MYSENNYIKKRHGFTTFWLIFSLIAQVISGIIYLLSMQLLADFYNVSRSLILLYGIISLVGAVGSVLLLIWKKIGFWIFIGISIASLILNNIIGIPIRTTLIGLLGVVIMWAVLQIRKNGKTTWEQLI
jgi:hypothetical protein